jgi:hypothetical protein
MERAFGRMIKAVMNNLILNGKGSGFLEIMD